MKRIILPFFLIAVVSTNSFAKNSSINQSHPLVCAVTLKEHSKLKDKWPSNLSELPIHFGNEAVNTDSDPLVFMNLTEQNNSLVLKSNVLFKGIKYEDQIEIKKFCVNKLNQNIEISFVNGTQINLNYENGQYNTNNTSLKILTAEQTEQLDSRINAAPVTPPHPVNEGVSR